MSFASQNIYRAEIGNGEVFVVSTAGMHKDPRNCGLELLKIGSIALVSALFRSSSQAYHILYCRIVQVFFLFFSKNFNINNFLPKFKLFTRHVTDLQPLRKKHQLIFLIDGFFRAALVYVCYFITKIPVNTYSVSPVDGKRFNASSTDSTFVYA